MNFVSHLFALFTAVKGACGVLKSFFLCFCCVHALVPRLVRGVCTHLFRTVVVVVGATCMHMAHSLGARFSERRPLRFTGHVKCAQPRTFCAEFFLPFGPKTDAKEQCSLVEDDIASFPVTMRGGIVKPLHSLSHSLDEGKNGVGVSCWGQRYKPFANWW